MARNEDLTSSSPPSNKSILIGLGGGILIGSLILVTTILPAEFGVDPLGVGNLLGLTELSRAENPYEEQYCIPSPVTEIRCEATCVESKVVVPEPVTV